MGSTGDRLLAVSHPVEVSDSCLSVNPESGVLSNMRHMQRSVGNLGTFQVYENNRDLHFPRLSFGRKLFADCFLTCS